MPDEVLAPPNRLGSLRRIVREKYERLKIPAKALGAAFQKVNFLRDMGADYKERGRVYFPGIDFVNFEEEAKKQIEKEVQCDFEAAYIGIMQLPAGARSGVLLAYKYYVGLFNRIRKISVSRIKHVRIRVPDFYKLFMLLETYIQRHVFSLIPRTL